MTVRREVALLVDSGAALQERVEDGLAVVRLHVAIGGETLDGDTDDEVYRRLRNGDHATTSTPSPGDYLSAMNALADGGFAAIVCLTIPSRWSGMHSSATLAAATLAAERPSIAVRVVETSTAAAAFGLVARAVDMRCVAGDTIDEVLECVARACDDVRMYGALATLEFVARSGRVPALVAGVSDALRVRPVFEMNRGGTGRVGLARTDGGVLRLLERVARDRFRPPLPIWLMLFHADAEAMALRLGDCIAASCRVVRVETVGLDPVIGVHTGPGAVGFAALPVQQRTPAPSR